MAYTDLATVRAMEEMGDTALILDATITEAIAYAEELIDRFTGTSWEYKTFSVTLDGSGSGTIFLKDDEGRPVLYPRSVTSAIVDNTSCNPYKWALYPEGYVVRDEGSFSSTHPGRNVTISGTAGMTAAAPEDIKWCARTIARQYILDLVGRVPDRAMSLNTSEGVVTIAQASGHPDRPTSLPEVNARLVRRRQRGPTFI